MCFGREDILVRDSIKIIANLLPHPNFRGKTKMLNLGGSSSFGMSINVIISQRVLYVLFRFKVVLFNHELQLF
jgi:hypothetical protein